MRLEIDKGRSVELIKPKEIENIYQAIISTHAGSILKKEPMDGSDGIHNLTLLLACHESAKKNGEEIQIGG